MDFDNLELTGVIDDHIVGRQLLELLDDTPPQSMPMKIDVAMLDTQFNIAGNMRHGSTDEFWERTVTWMRLADYGVGQPASGDESQVSANS
ncbi:hypothetical protein [Peristeroidobacter soli]|uniref:hypothetical protein n=1 Tax=Peristeroidobacter soli TaxID=2497877 RepID=UPI00101C0D93|nr:hypothetical protein [Peristeroidobacter soli]